MDDRPFGAILKNNKNRQKNMLKKIGPIQQKILVLCLTGIGLGFASSPTQSFGLFRAAGEEWKNINRQTLKRSLRSLQNSKLLKEKRRADGTVTLELTEAGKRQARYWSIFGQGIKIRKQKSWDKLWRVVMFDIPEENRRFRNILRSHLKTIGFRELQHSVFIFPYACEKEIACLVDLYAANKYVRVLTVKTIDNETELSRHFFKKKKVSK